MIATLFVVFAFASSALGQCPVPLPVPAVDLSKIAGRWYEIAGLTAGEFIESRACTTHDFTPREDGNFNCSFGGIKTDGSKFSDIGIAKRTDIPNLLNLNSLTEMVPWPINFYVADTDYDNYLAASFCMDIPQLLITVRVGMILSRTNTMSADKYAELTDLLVNKIGLPSDSIQSTIQKDCKYWPVSELQQSEEIEYSPFN
uniref:Lipocalin/cytosolic fatty-acid binding domain-containing protein n=2 Tax=Tetranychus urticae TaxID=32264 RepID=T1KQR8_TETUR